MDESLPIVSAKSLKVLCDPRLWELVHQLRNCGIDATMLSDADDDDVTAKAAIDDQRVILTCGRAFGRLKKLVPPGRCVYVAVDLPKLQCLQVLRHFNVRIDPADIFSRCQL